MDNSSKVAPNFTALIPFIIFVIFYAGLSIWAQDFYKVPMPIAFIVASATAFLLNRKSSIDKKIDVYVSGMGDSNIMLMCLIFILAGSFAAVAKAIGAVDAAAKSIHSTPTVTLPPFQARILESGAVHSQPDRSVL